MKLARFALTPPIAAISVALFAALGARATVLEGYTGLKYIESTGTQWIDTMVVPNANTEIVTQYQLTAMPTDEHKGYVFGEWGNAGRLQFAHQANGKGFFGFGEQAGYDGSTVDLANDLDIHVVAYMNGVFTVDGNFKKELKTWGGAPVSLWLFACNGNGSPSANSIGCLRIYSCQIYDGETLVRDFVPVLDANGKPGLLDVAQGRNEFYVNKATSGDDFTPGPVVNGIMVVGVPSAYGNPDPGYGLKEDLSPGTTCTFTAPAVWTNAEETVAATCIGYKVYTNDVVYVEGSGNSFTYEHPDCEMGAKLVWQ